MKELEININNSPIGALEVEKFKMALKLADNGSQEAMELRDKLIEDEGNYTEEELNTWDQAVLYSYTKKVTHHKMMSQIGVWKKATN